MARVVHVTEGASWALGANPSVGPRVACKAPAIYGGHAAVRGSGLECTAGACNRSCQILKGTRRAWQAGPTVGSRCPHVAFAVCQSSARLIGHRTRRTCHTLAPVCRRVRVDTARGTTFRPRRTRVLASLTFSACCSRRPRECPRPALLTRISAHLRIRTSPALGAVAGVHARERPRPTLDATRRYISRVLAPHALCTRAGTCS